MTISVIVPTYNGAHKIPNILRALKSQTVQLDEVLIVVDGSTDDTVKILQPFISESSSIRMIVQKNQGRAAVRNRGAQEARGDLLVFFDDDIRPEPWCVAEHLAHHREYPSSIAVGVAVEEYDKMTTDFQHFRAYLSRKWMQDFAGELTWRIDPQKPFLMAANCSLPKALFKQLAGFDASLTDAEDFDLAMRASEAGVPVYFLNNAKAWHDDFVSCTSYVKRLREYKKAHQKLAETRPELFYKYTTAEVKPTQKLKSILFSLFAHRYWIHLIDSGTMASILPKGARFKLYDVVITALSTYHSESKK